MAKLLVGWKVHIAFCLNPEHAEKNDGTFFLLTKDNPLETLQKLSCPVCKKTVAFKVNPLPEEDFFAWVQEEKLSRGFTVQNNQYEEMDLDGIRNELKNEEKTPADETDKPKPIKIDVKGLDAHLASRVVGQPIARRKIVRRTRVASRGLVNPNKPRGIFFVMGPPGTGKTKLAEEFCIFVTGSLDNLVVLDMSRYQDQFDSKNIAGAPPGYIGYGDEPELAAVKGMPIAVVLLDEFEKAHTSVWRTFLRIFDKGKLAVRVRTNPDNPHDHGAHVEVIDFTHCFFLLTSNLGSEKMLGQIKGHELGFRAPKTGKDLDPENEIYEIGKKELERECRERRISEFTRRIHEIIVLHPLAGEETLNAIIDIKMKEYEEMGVFHENSLTVVLSEEAKRFIRERCGKHLELGAGSIEQDIEHFVFDALDRGLEDKTIKPGDTVIIKGPINGKNGEDDIDETILDFEVTPQPQALTDGKRPSGT